jgi:hypothetical protein
MSTESSSLLIQRYFKQREEPEKSISGGFMNIGSIHHKKGVRGGKLISQVEYCSHFMHKEDHVLA